jgi:hypothetical protein
MRLSRLILAVGFVAMAALSATVAKADGVVDPRIHIGDPDCAEGATVFTGGTLDVTLTDTDPLANLCYEPADGVTPLTTLNLLLTIDPTQTYSFDSTVFLNTPAITFPDFPPNPLVWNVFFSGGSLAPDNGLTVSADCAGAPLSTCLGTPLILAVSAPEPNTLLLLLVGLVSVIWIGRKSWVAAHPA